MSATKATDRAKRLAGMFGAVDPAALAKQAEQEKNADRSMTTAPTKALKASFANIEQENIRLKAELEKAQVLELDPAICRPPLVQDRLEWTDDDPDFQSLLTSIDAEGQRLPILVRQHPTEPGVYQIAYGMRRTRACQVLGRTVKAYVQELTDEELILAQGLENNERKNLSFIEQALYAQSLSREGYNRRLIARAVGVSDETNVSKMATIAGQIPLGIVRLIGAAPKIGRTRWAAFAELLDGEGKGALAETALQVLPGSAVWASADTNKRFDLAFRTAQKALIAKPVKAKPQKRALERLGRTFGALEESDTAVKITLNAKSEPAFARFLAERMDALMEEFHELERGGEPTH